MVFQEKRPTCVSVIGWVWAILGGLMLFSSVMALLSWNMLEASKADPEFQRNMPSIMKYFQYLALFQIILGLTGLVAGISFLKLKSWSRTVLEVATWILLVVIAGFSAYWEIGWVSMSWSHGSNGIDIMGSVMGLFMLSVYIVPLVIMLKYLRGSKVRDAIKWKTEHVASVDALHR